jgi:hypothetical protein
MSPHSTTSREPSIQYTSLWGTVQIETITVSTILSFFNLKAEQQQKKLARLLVPLRLEGI